MIPCFTPKVKGLCPDFKLECEKKMTKFELNANVTPAGDPRPKLSSETDSILFSPGAVGAGRDNRIESFWYATL